VKLQDCHLRLRTVVTPPFERNEPENDWRDAKNRGNIPEQLWNFYRATRYPSASALAGYDTPDSRVVTVYFTRLIRSVKECLIDAAELREDMRQFYPRQYNPLRSFPNEFDQDAARRHRSAFRSLLVNLVGALDVLADTFVVLFPRAIPKVRAGGAAFTDVEKWLQKPHDVPSGIVSPAEHFIAVLHEKLKPIVVVRSGPETDWLPLMRMHRNKSAHLGHQSYTQFGVENKAGGISFFIPRSWPFVAEQFAETGKPAVPNDTEIDFSDVLNQWLMHQDIEEYSEGAYRKIWKTIDVSFAVLNDGYIQLKHVPVASETLEDLDRNRQSYNFEYFEAVG
jgi:hypothetical protein